VSGWIEIAFNRPAAFNTVTVVEPRSSEYYGAASRIEAYHVQRWDKGAWVEVLSGRTPDKVQIHQFHRTIAERVRLTITGVAKPPGIAELGIYDEPVGAGIDRAGTTSGGREQRHS
jgi:hypothetical protein